MKIYWSYIHKKHNDEYIIDKQMFEPPERLNKHIDIKEMFGPLTAACPAISDDFKNTLVFKAPIDIDLEFDNDMRNFTCRRGYSVPFINHLFSAPTPERLLQLRSPMILLYAETDVTATQLPTYLDETHLNQSVNFVSGTYNIGQWIRPLHSAFRLKPFFHRLRINKGDPVCYIKINTNEKISLHEFDSEGFYEQEGSPLKFCLELKDEKPAHKTYPLNYCYDQFNKLEYKTKVLDWINDRLVK